MIQSLFSKSKNVSASSPYYENRGTYQSSQTSNTQEYQAGQNAYRNLNQQGTRSVLNSGYNQYQNQAQTQNVRNEYKQYKNVRSEGNQWPNMQKVFGRQQVARPALVPQRTNPVANSGIPSQSVVNHQNTGTPSYAETGSQEQVHYGNPTHYEAPQQWQNYENAGSRPRKTVYPGYQPAQQPRYQVEPRNVGQPTRTNSNPSATSITIPKGK